MIILIASVSVLAAYFIASALPFFKDANKPVVVKTTEPITATFDEVDKTIFNKNAINPTVEVIIGTNGQVSSTSSDTNASSTTETGQ